MADRIRAGRPIVRVAGRVMHPGGLHRRMRRAGVERLHRHAAQTRRHEHEGERDPTGATEQAHHVWNLAARRGVVQVRVNSQRSTVGISRLMTVDPSTDRAGFEPAKRGYRLRAFQARLFNHSSTRPRGPWLGGGNIVARGETRQPAAAAA